MSEKRSDTPRTPLVSAVITTYDRPFAMVREAIESVLAQTYPAIELIVVSDNDPKSDIAKEVARGMVEYPKVIFLQAQAHRNGQFARNAGIRAAKGAYIAFLDDDDLWLPRKIELQMPAFTDPRIGLVYCQGQRFSDADRTKTALYTTLDRMPSIVRFDDQLRTDYIGATSRVIVRRACFDRVGFFDERLPARQDYDMWLRIAQVWGGAYIDEMLFMQRQHAGARVSKNKDNVFLAYRILREKYRSVYRKKRFALCTLFWDAAWNSVFDRTAYRYILLLRAFLASPKSFYETYRREHQLRR